MENLDPSSSLYYTSPATTWEESLPIGNGRLGAMVYGRTFTELLQLNENSVWYGGTQDRSPRDALKNLEKLRTLIRAGNSAEAEKLVRRAFFATPHSQRHYEPLGTLTLEFGHDGSKVQNYQRSLDLETAIQSTRYECRGVEYSRTVFASYPDDILLMKLEASKKMEFVVRLTRVSEREYETNEFLDSLVARDGEIVMLATPGGEGSNRLCCVVKVKCEDDGSIGVVGNCLVVNTCKATVIIAAQTQFRHNDPRQVRSYVELTFRILYI